MATGVPFPEANSVLLAPPSAAAGDVYDLHVHRFFDDRGDAHVLSKWQLTPEELANVVSSGGVLWFVAEGVTHPPVSIIGHDPFVRS